VAAERATAQLAERGAGRCSISGALTFETVPWLWEQLTAGGLLQSAQEADLAAVGDADSAGLALLIAWRASRRCAGGDVRFTGTPARLTALAQLTEAGTLLEPAAASGG
jgi:ABC-type transporter Mla MlaB component